MKKLSASRRGLRRSLRLALASSLLLVVTDCSKKDDLVSPVGAKVTAQNDQTPPLSWEGISFMPVAPNTPNTIRTPWSGGTGTAISDDMLNDYHQADGWVLLYNTFNTQTTPGTYYFVLYNKFRGLVRLYYYNPQNSTTFANQSVINTLALDGTNAGQSHLLNFAAQDIVDLGVNSRFATTAQKGGASPDTWYAFQYELAYDPGVTSQSFQNLYLRWPFQGLDVKELSVDGKIQGDITGTITVPGANISLTTGASNVINSSGGTQVIEGAGDADGLLASLGQAAVDGIKGAITDGVSGVIKGVLSGIFGSDPNQPNTHLQVNENVSLKGTLSSSAPLRSLLFYVPGTNQTGATGYNPADNTALGVFYLSSAPTYARTKYYSGNGTTVPTTTYFVTPDAADNEARLVFNPAVLASASIQNIHQELVAVENGGTNASGIRETVGANQYLTGTGLQAESIAPAIAGIRISFDVVPNNGARRVRLVKTFAATMSSEQVITLPPGQDPD